MTLTVEKLEKACRKAGQVPVMRGTVGGYDLLIADGFSKDPHIPFRKFDVKKGRFPLGAFATLWILSNDGKVKIASQVFFEALHEVHLTTEVRQQARINAARLEVEGFLISEDKVKREHGRGILHS